MTEDINLTSENLGARRLLGVIEKVTENIGFQGPDSEVKEYVIDEGYIMQEMKDHFAKVDLRRYML